MVETLEVIEDYLKKKHGAVKDLLTSRLSNSIMVITEDFVKYPTPDSLKIDWMLQLSWNEKKWISEVHVNEKPIRSLV